MCVIFIFISSVGEAAPRCSVIFKQVSTNRLSKKIFSQFVKVSESDSIFTEVRVPVHREEPKGYYLLLHGLLDSGARWSAVERGLLDSGYGVIKVDLLGHGRSLERLYAEHGEIPGEISYIRQVEAVYGLLRRLKEDLSISRPYVMGHSYGGGIAIALAAHPQYSKAIGNQLVLLAPYIFRLDHYHQDKHIEAVTPNAGVFTEMVGSWVSGLVKSMNGSVGMEYAMDTFMRDSFRRYLKEEGLNARLDESIQVDSAVAVTKGIQDFDARELAAKIRVSMNIKLILGSEDIVSPEALEVDFFNSLRPNQKKSLLKLLGVDHQLTVRTPEEIVMWSLPETKMRSVYSKHKADGIYEVPIAR